MMVDLKLVRQFPEPLTLEKLKGVAGLKEMELLRRGSRLSVQPVTRSQFDLILKLAK
jgi:predicted RNA-binding protein with PUA-like domain